MPTDGEWTEAGRLASNSRAQAVVLGHTHSVRFRQEGDLTCVNSGTWIHLIQLPAADAAEEVWLDFLCTLRRNPSLKASQGEAVSTIKRFTGVTLEAHPSGGAKVSLFEWSGGKSTVLSEAQIGACGRVSPAHRAPDWRGVEWHPRRRRQPEQRIGAAEHPGHAAGHVAGGAEEHRLAAGPQDLAGLEQVGPGDAVGHRVQPAWDAASVGRYRSWLQAQSQLRPGPTPRGDSCREVASCPGRLRPIQAQGGLG